MIRPTVLVAAALVALALPAAADTLYVAAPPPAAPGHPLELGPDHRAQQIGDLIHILFNFNTTTSNSNSTQSNNTYSASANPATGLAGLPLLRLGFGLGSTAQVQMGKTEAATQQFSAEMTATVTDVLPSGALVVAGTQNITVNGDPQQLLITGTVRPEDVDNTDTVLSSLVANVKVAFSGLQTPGQKKSVLQKILGWLF